MYKEKYREKKSRTNTSKKNEQPSCAQGLFSFIHANSSRKASSAASPAPITAPRQHRKPRVCRLPETVAAKTAYSLLQLYTESTHTHESLVLTAWMMMGLDDDKNCSSSTCLLSFCRWSFCGNTQPNLTLPNKSSFFLLCTLHSVYGTVLYAYSALPSVSALRGSLDQPTKHVITLH